MRVDFRQPEELMKIGLILLSVLFVALLCILAINARFATDDFHLLYISDNFSVAGAIDHEYNTWLTRWSATTVLFSALSLGYGGPFLTLYLLSIFVFTTITIGVGLRTILPNVGRTRLITLAVVVCASVFLTTYSIGETWFWFASSATYLLSFSFLVLGVVLLFRKEKKWWHYLIVAICFLYVGGALAPLAILCVLGLLVTNYWRYRKGAMNLWMMLPILTCAVGFIILYQGEGNRVREAFFDDMSVGRALVLNFKMCGILIFKRLIYVLPYLVPFAFLLRYLFREPLSLIKWPWTSRYKRALLVLGVLAFILYVYQLPITYKTHDIAADRALLILSACTLLAVVLLVDLFLRNANQMTAGLALAGLILYLGFEVYNQNNITSSYAKAYDNRLEALKFHAQHTEDGLWLEELPSPGMLMSAEISEDPSHHSNFHLARYFGLEYVRLFKSNQR